MKRFISLVVLAALLVSMLVAVGAVTAQDDEVVIVVGWEQEPAKLYPLNSLVFGLLLEQFYTRQVWDWDENREIYPIMVEEIPSFENGLVEINDEGDTVVTYNLREGMLWSDGEPVTSADCAFGHRIFKDPSASAQIGRAAYDSVVKDLIVIDELSFQLVYDGSFPDFAASEDQSARCHYPAHVLEPILEADGSLDETDYFDGVGVVGYAPFRLVEWNKGESIIFEKNEFWDGEEPKVDRIILRMIFESAQMVNAMETGEIDYSFGWPATLRNQYNEIPGVETWATDSVLADALWVNTAAPGHPALHDVRVREAIAHALDRPAMAAGIIGEGVTVPLSWYPSVLWAEDHPYREYNVEGAMALLDEAGWVDSNGNGTRDKDGVELILRFYTTTRQDREDYQLVIQEYLNEVGIGTQVIPTSATVLFGNYAERGLFAGHDFDLALFANSAKALSPNGDPDTYSCSAIGTPENPDGFNGMSWCDERYDELDELIRATVDPAEREELVAEAQLHFYDGAFWHGLHVRQTYFALNTDRWDISTFTDVGTLTGNWTNNAEFWAPAN